MKAKHLASDATIRDVLETLGDADGYVSNVRRKMSKAGGEADEVTVRIGIIGKGMYPAYKIELVESGRPAVAYGGQNHSPFTDVELTEENWSSEVMSLASVTELLKEMRG